MPMAIEAAQDAYLNRICDTVENLYICSQEPANFTEASSTYKLGTKATPSIGAAANDTPNGRKRDVATFSDGTVDSTGTASHVSLTDDSLSELLMAQALAATQAVTASNSFSLTAFKVAIADPT